MSQKVEEKNVKQEEYNLDDEIKDECDIYKAETHWLSKILHLIYPKHVKDKENFKKFLQERSKKIRIQEVHIANETGLTGHEHAHVAIKFKDKPDWKGFEKFDLGSKKEKNVIHPHWVKWKNQTKAWQKLKNYLSKQDKECKDLYVPIVQDLKEEIEIVEKCEDSNEACKRLARKWGDVAGIKMIHKDRKTKQRKIQNVIDEQGMNSFQKRIMHDYNNLERGKILWIYDPKGQSGKTTIGKYLKREKKAYFVKFKSEENCLCLLMKQWKETMDLDVFINVSKFARTDGLLSMVEDISDGLVSKDKYLPEEMEWEKEPKVVVLSNRLPPGNLSEGRVKISQITEIESPTK